MFSSEIPSLLNEKSLNAAFVTNCNDIDDDEVIFVKSVNPSTEKTKDVIKLLFFFYLKFFYSQILFLYQIAEIIK